MEQKAYWNSVIGTQITSHYNFINPRCACAARVTVLALCVCVSVCVCVCVCVSVSSYSRATGTKSAHEPCQLL